MAWIPVDQSLRDHRKVLALAGELDVDQATAVGHLVLFWLWCMDNAPTGILKRINGLQIATAAAWSGNPNDLLEALLSAGFLEKCGRGAISLRIHDWGQYGGRLCVARVANKERMRQTRASLDQSRSDQSREEKNRSTPLSPPKGGQVSSSEIRHVSLKARTHAAAGLWGRALAKLQPQVTKPNYETWLKETVGFALEGDKLVILAPNEFAMEWLSTKLRPLIAKTVSGLAGKPMEIEFVLAED